MRFLLILLTLAISTSFAAAQAEIRPPFGFFWGESLENVQETLKGVGAKASEPREVADRKVIEVTGLIRPGMKQALFYFRQDALVEIELQYQDPEWSPARYNDLLTRSFDLLRELYGFGTRVEETGETDGVMQGIKGWEWSGFDSQALLVLYSAEKESDLFQSMSIHYRYAFASDFDEPRDGGSSLSLDALSDPLPIGGGFDSGGMGTEGSGTLADPLPITDSETTEDKAPAAPEAPEAPENPEVPGETPTGDDGNLPVGTMPLSDDAELDELGAEKVGEDLATDAAVDKITENIQENVQDPNAATESSEKIQEVPASTVKDAMEVVDEKVKEQE